MTPSDEDAIVVPCPQIIEPDVMAQVAASRTKAAPRVTPPRITNSPVLLTGVARCNEGECDAGLTIRTGKGGRYAYYTCNAKASAGAERCGVKAIRQEELDRVVLDVLLKRVLEPERLKLLLAQVLERSDEADARRKADLDRVRRERVAAEGRLRRLYELVEEGHASARDPLFAARLGEHRASIAQLQASERSLSGQLAAGERRIDEATVERFGDMVRDRLVNGEQALRKGYVRLFVSDVALSNSEILIAGTRTALEAALVHGDRTGTPMVPSFDREWCPEEDSNLHALASAST